MKYLTYKNEFKGISIKYPETWEIKEGSPNPVVIFISPSGSSLNVMVRTVYEKTFDQYFQESLQGASNSIEKFKLIDNKKFDFHGVDAAELTFQGINSVDKKSMMKYHVFTTKVGHIAYDITYSACSENYDSHLPVAKKIIASFDII